MCIHIMVTKEMQVILSFFTSLRSPLISLLKLFYLKKFVFGCAYVGVFAHEHRCLQKAELQVHLDLKLQVVDSCPMWVLGTELGLSARAIHTMTQWVVSSAYLLFDEYLKSSRLAGFQWTIPCYSFPVHFVNQITKCFSSRRTLLFLT